MKSENSGPSQGVRGSLRIVRATPVDTRHAQLKEAKRRLGLKNHDIRLVLVFLGEMEDVYENDEELLEALLDLED